ncbi:hypothetical protein C8A00DRAFT_42811 [Chaetomidium leptoderma]|uniref:Mediator of RNA polymerase II transcription subunit 9 n=1 Tax=Chaetomidium leptoderma TaxID=669021 RepID=A0AAN6VQ63_9PEZI|nr:hypothetical protein C8A00DRAFT_42811 [Chaetomidium leptoderma]
MATHLPQGLSPDAVDVLTELASIVTRLRGAAAAASTAQGINTTTAAGTTTTAGPTTSGATVSGATPAPLFGVTGTTPLPMTTGNTPGGPNPNNNNNHPFSSSTGGGGSGGGGGTQLLLSVKELPAATDNLKHKLQRARAAMRTLGDVQRTIARQEAEMAGLEARRRAQAGRLVRAQEDGLQFVKSEGLRGGEEEMGVVVVGAGGDRMVE